MSPATVVRIAVAVIEDRGRFLIGQRDSGVALAGLWEFPGGKIEPGETPPAAAARECLEETGLSIEVGALYDEVSYRYEHGDVQLYFFACRALASTESLPGRFRWVNAEELTSYSFPAANARLVELLSRGRTDPSPRPLSDSTDVA